MCVDNKKALGFLVANESKVHILHTHLCMSKSFAKLTIFLSFILGNLGVQNMALVLNNKANHKFKIQNFVCGGYTVFILRVRPSVTFVYLIS